MRVEKIRINRWRNFEGVQFDVPLDATLICLAGENGTGKSNILELLSAAAARLGLSPGVAIRRGDPLSEPHDISVTLRLPDDFVPPSEFEQQLNSLRPHFDEWDRTLELHSSNLSPAEGGMEGPKVPFLAGGIGDPTMARVVADVLIASLQQQQEVNHLFLDADRSFPPFTVQDQEIWELRRQDLTLPAWVRQQAGVLTQNMYSEWLKAMLAQAIRSQADFWERANAAKRAGEAIPEPVDDLEPLRQAVEQILPYLRVKRLDQDQRTLLFDSAGEELRYESLSGGEREIAFLVGQIERFQLRRGLLLLDEPELHLNPELLRRWLSYIKSSVDEGQVWIATHALEAAEAAGLDATFVFERSEDRRVRTVARLGDRPALRVLAGALGSPAFSLARSRFVLIEGERPGREREKMAEVLDIDESTTFVEAGGFSQVLRKFEAVKDLAAETDQLRIGAIIDRDLRTDEQAQELEAGASVHVLPCHEIENFFLHPDAIGALLEQVGRNAGEAHGLIQREADRQAGRWILERARTFGQWEEIANDVRARATDLTWSDIEADKSGQIKAWAALDPSGNQKAQRQRRTELLRAAGDYEQCRVDVSRLWKECFGKEVLRGVARALALQSAEAIEARVLKLWSSGEVKRPPEVNLTRAYVDGIEVLPP
jgi:energy-coupling factor transporter ATP-binding protein EcfA2